MTSAWMPDARVVWFDQMLIKPPPTHVQTFLDGWVIMMGLISLSASASYGARAKSSGIPMEVVRPTCAGVQKCGALVGAFSLSPNAL